MAHPRRLKADYVGSYDGQGSVETFISRMYSLSNRYGMEPVLEFLPLCLKSEAQSWYDMLDYDLKEQMNHYEAMWCFHYAAASRKTMSLRIDPTSYAV